MSPEQDSRQSKPHPAQDVFCLGIVAFEVAFGSDRQILPDIADSQIPGLIRKMCDPLPSKRPSLEEVIEQAGKLVGERVGIPLTTRVWQGAALAAGAAIDLSGGFGAASTVTLSFAALLEHRARANRMKLTFPPLKAPLH